jgi:hypothetical protein
LTASQTQALKSLLHLSSTLALAIPVATLRHLVATRDLASLPPCGSE